MFSLACVLSPPLLVMFFSYVSCQANRSSDMTINTCRFTLLYSLPVAGFYDAVFFFFLYVKINSCGAGMEQNSYTALSYL